MRPYGVRRHGLGALLAPLLLLAGCQPSEPRPVTVASPPPSAGQTRPDEAPSGEAATPKEVAFEAADGKTVYADLYTSRRGGRTVALLFHQAGSNAGEYEGLAPDLCEVGFDCLAVDQRSGGRMWDRDNRTVAKAGGSSDYEAAYADLEGALKWAHSQGKYSRVVVAGSSYSASLAFRLSTEHEGVHAILAFSPGEYIGAPGTVERWAKAWRGPLFVSASPEEAEGDAKRLFEASARTNDAPTMLASHPGGVHGASVFRPDRCQAADAYKRDLLGFLEGLRPKRTTVGAIMEPTTE